MNAIGVSATVQTEVLIEINSSLHEANGALKILQGVTKEAMGIADNKVRAHYYRNYVQPAMEALRRPIDRLEMLVDKEVWPMPSYGDLMFEI